jgi:hypothetical protein
MNPFLRRRVNGKPLHPHAPVTLKSARLTFTPKPHAGRDLPQERAETRCDHDKEQDLHPRRDVAEDFPGGVIYIGHSKLGAEASSLMEERDSCLSFRNQTAARMPLSAPVMMAMPQRTPLINNPLSWLNPGESIR